MHIKRFVTSAAIFVAVLPVPLNLLGAQTRDTIAAPAVIPADTAIVLTNARRDSLRTLDSVSTVRDNFAVITRAQPLTWLIDDNSVRTVRLGELRGDSTILPMLLRSPSVFFGRSTARPVLVVVGVESQGVENSAIPYSRNDGGLWAGRGRSTRSTLAVGVQAGPFRLILAPEYITAGNETFSLRDSVFINVPIPQTRRIYSFPWYATGPYSIDMPTRFGDQSIARIRPGQSSATVAIRNVEIGVATENEWWGPSIDNALVLSNNAPGFPHGIIRSRKPFLTRLGKLDFRWLVGGLRESDFFDFDGANNLRSVSAAAVTLVPARVPNLTFGLSRSVIATASGWNQVSLRWLDVLSGTGHPNDRALSDSSLYPGGKDQVYSLFARWVFPGDGAELYAELGKTEFPRSLRDFLVHPNHTLAYTYGLQWTRAGLRPTHLLHVRAENTSVEQSPTFRARPLGVWYTSRTVVQGYTNEGQPLGAAVGPGSSGQTVELNYWVGASSVGLEAGRTRYNDDVHNISPIISYLRWCSHDVGTQWGAHAGLSSRYGYLSVRALFQNRINIWFQGAHGCPTSTGNIDVQNRNLSITFKPAVLVW